jgi:hypothetical protein
MSNAKETAEAAIKFAALLNSANSRVATAVERSVGMSAQTFRLLESIIDHPQEPVNFHTRAMGLTSPPNCSYGLRCLIGSGYIVVRDGPATGVRDLRSSYHIATPDGIRFAQRARRLAGQAVCAALLCPQVEALQAACASLPAVRATEW